MVHNYQPLPRQEEENPFECDPTATRRSRVAQWFRGLRAQILLWTILPLTLILIGVAFTGVFSHDQSMRVLVAERDRALAQVAASEIADDLREKVEALETIAGDDAFLHRNIDGIHVSLAEADALGGLLVNNVVLLDDSGRVLAAGGDFAEEWSGQSDHFAPLVNQVMSTQEPAAIALHPSAGEGGLLLLGVPVHNAATTYGVLVGLIPLRSLSLDTVLAQVPLGENGAAYLIDARDRVLASFPPARALSLLASTSDVAGETTPTKAAGASMLRSSDGQLVSMASAEVNLAHIGWQVRIAQPWREVIGPVLRYSQFMPLVAALGAIVSLLTLYHGVRSIVRPLQALGRKAERVAWGDFSATNDPVGGVKEIEDLRCTLDEMASRIQSYQIGMHDYIAALTQGQEDERRRLARELHDDTTQSLIAVRHQLELAQKAVTSDPPLALKRIAEIREVLAETLDGVRRFSHDLRPHYLEDLGFIPAVEMLVREKAHPAGLSIHFSTTGSVRRLPADFELTAYRIVQEALNNAIQHAHAANVWVEIGFETRHLTLTLRDDGRGFEVPSPPAILARRGNFGLMGIQERALLYGGQLNIWSEPAAGTQITVRLPFPPQH